VGVQEVRWDGGGTEPAGEYTFFYGKGNENNELGTGFFILSQLLNVHRVRDVRQIEIHRAEPLVPDPSPSEVEIAIAKLKINHQAVIKLRPK
jgi:hypothetical protein